MKSFMFLFIFVNFYRNIHFIYTVNINFQCIQLQLIKTQFCFFIILCTIYDNRKQHFPVKKTNLKIMIRKSLQKFFHLNKIIIIFNFTKIIIILIKQL